MNIISKLAMLITIPSSLMASATLLNHNNTDNQAPYTNSYNKGSYADKQLKTTPNWNDYKTTALKVTPQELLKEAAKTDWFKNSNQANSETTHKWDSNSWYRNYGSGTAVPEWDVYGGQGAKTDLSNGKPHTIGKAILAIISIKGQEGFRSSCPILAMNSFADNNYDLSSWILISMVQNQSQATSDLEKFEHFKAASLRVTPLQLLEKAVHTNWFWKTWNTKMPHPETKKQWGNDSWYTNGFNQLTPEWDIYGGEGGPTPDLTQGKPRVFGNTIMAIISIKGREGLRSSCPIMAMNQFDNVDNNSYDLSTWILMPIFQPQSKENAANETFKPILENLNPNVLLAQASKSDWFLHNKFWQPPLNWYFNPYDPSSGLKNAEWDVYGGIDNNDPAGGGDLMHGAPTMKDHTITAIFSVKGCEGIGGACPIKAVLNTYSNDMVYDIKSWVMTPVRQLESKKMFAYQISKEVANANDSEGAYVPWMFLNHNWTNKEHTQSLWQKIGAELDRAQCANFRWESAPYSYRTIKQNSRTIEFRMDFRLTTHSWFWERNAIFETSVDFESTATNYSITDHPFNHTWWMSGLIWENQ